MSATLKIPKVLTAIELKALMMKANKLFNLAEVQISSVGANRSGYTKLSDEEKNELVSNYDKTETIA